MIELVRALDRHANYGQRLAGVSLALVCAEAFYRFHSFTLEFLAFLATWFLFDVLLKSIFGRPVKKNEVNPNE
jgi:hypothetical protein